MPYDFQTLSPNDFEALVCDLLTREWRTLLESFKSGKDQGIDLRNALSSSTNGPTIVQCKRYAPDKISALLRSVELEIPKIRRLNPGRYVIVTSVALSPENKRHLLDRLRPWCKGSNDILGASEINTLLRKYPDVERSHFKLWISSTAVLERVLHSNIFAITDATIETTKEQLRTLVVHAGLEHAIDILESHHHALIVGSPGVGKTTLARMILCHYVSEGFLPIVITGTIENAWRVLDSAEKNGRPLVILYDDFLGTLKFSSSRFEKNEDHSLIEFLGVARRTQSIRLILTTREYILEDAKSVHGAFAEHANEIEKYTLLGMVCVSQRHWPSMR